MGGSSGSREPSPSVSALTGFDPERESDMDRAFNIAMLTLNFSLHHNACARRFYADDMNNRAGHLTPYMAARVIAATMAAHQAILLERRAIVRWLSEISVSLNLISPRATADALNGKEHIPAQAIEARSAETGNTDSAEGESAVTK
jgi:hypothetical protein